ncbi:hypothetical protein MTO96_002815 [Rhipicephalus appendiculatus]
MCGTALGRCEDEWTYGDGVAQWPNLDLDVPNQCGGMYQSPINIVTRRTYYDNLDVVRYYGYLDPLQNISIVNDGHTVKMHLVHMNTKYSTGEEALKHSDGLAVVAVFFQVSSSDNSALSAIVGALRQMREKSTTRVNLTSIPPLRQLMPRDPQLYYRYQGSLTTPPCSEAVTWTVLAQPSRISEAQLQAFRDLVVDHGNGSSPEPLVNNFRPVTPLNGRTVLRNF